MVTAAMKLKDTYSFKKKSYGRKVMTNIDNILKKKKKKKKKTHRHYFADKRSVMSTLWFFQ